MRRSILFAIATLVLYSLVVSSAHTKKEKVSLFIPAPDSFEIEILQKTIKTFEAKHPGIHVDLSFESYSYYDQKLQMMAFSGLVPDVFAVDVFHAPLAREIAQPLDEFLHRDPIEDDFDARLIEIFRFYDDQRLYYLPRSFHSLGLFYNRELLDLQGLGPPGNWNDLIQTVGRLTRREVDRFGITFSDATVSFLAFAITNGTPPLIERNTNEAFIDVGSDEAIRALEFYLELQRNLPSLPWLIGAEGAEQAFVSGRVAMLLGGSWSSHHIREMNPKLNYSVARLPCAETGGYGNLLFAKVYSIARQTKVPEEAWKLVRFLIGKESQELWLESNIGLPFYTDLKNRLLEEYPANEAFYADVDVAKLYSFDRIGSLYIPEVERAIKRASMGETTPAEALGHAVTEINNALAEMYE